MKFFFQVLAALLCSLSLLSAGGDGELRARTNAPVFKKLSRGVNVDTAVPDRGVWPKVQHQAAHFEAVADAGFESVRVFLPVRAPYESTERQIEDAMSRGLAIVVCLWGADEWSQNAEEGRREIADRWGELARAWSRFSGDLVFEILNEPAGIGFKKQEEGATVMSFYNAALQAIRDVDLDRPVLIGPPGFNDSEYLDPFVTEQFLTYRFDGGKGFYEDPNAGVAIHFYSPKHKDGLNFAMWTAPLGEDDAKWKTPVTEEVAKAVRWKERIGVDIPIITTEWGCWLFPGRSARDLRRWLDHHLELFTVHQIGHMWYTGIQNNQRAYALFNSETGWNQEVVQRITGVRPGKLPKVSQVINGEFFKPDLAWRVTSPDLVREYLYGEEAFSGSSMLKLTIPEGKRGELYQQSYSGQRGYKGAPGRTLLHLLQGATYEVSFVGASHDGEGRMAIVLESVKDEKELYNSYKSDGGWLHIGKDKRKYVRIYRHDGKTEMDVRLEFKFGVGPQVLYLDQVECTRR